MSFAQIIETRMYGLDPVLVRKSLHEFVTEGRARDRIRNRQRVSNNRHKSLVR